MHRCGAQVGKEPKLLADLEEPRLGPHRGIVPFGPAHCAEKDGVRRLARGNGFIRARISCLIERDAAKVVCIKREIKAELIAYAFERADRGLGNLGADPVAR